MKVVAEFSGPVVARVIRRFKLEIVVKLEVVGKVVGQFILVVGENYQVAVKVVVDLMGQWWPK